MGSTEVAIQQYGTVSIPPLTLSHGVYLYDMAPLDAHYNPLDWHDKTRIRKEAEVETKVAKKVQEEQAAKRDRERRLREEQEKQRLDEDAKATKRRKEEELARRVRSRRIRLEAEKARLERALRAREDRLRRGKQELVAIRREVEEAEKVKRKSSLHRAEHSRLTINRGRELRRLEKERTALLARKMELKNGLKRVEQQERANEQSMSRLAGEQDRAARAMRKGVASDAKDGYGKSTAASSKAGVERDVRGAEAAIARITIELEKVNKELHTFG